MSVAADEVLDRLRAICLGYPEAREEGGVGNPSFKVRGKIFAMRHGVGEHTSHGSRMSLWCKGAPGAQDVLVRSDAARFFVPPYVGHHGWIGIYLDGELDWDLIADLIDESYRMTAPKRLTYQLNQ